MSDPSRPEQDPLSPVMFVEAGRELYALDTAAQLAGVPADLLRDYCRAGLLGEALAAADEPVFDDDALYEVRRVEHYRQHHGVGPRALPLVMDLLREVERLHAELRLLR